MIRSHVSPCQESEGSDFLLPEPDKLRRAAALDVPVRLPLLGGHPLVPAARPTVRSGRLGWVYDIGTGTVAAFDRELERFVPVIEQPHTMNGVDTGAPENRCP